MSSKVYKSSGSETNERAGAYTMGSSWILKWLKVRCYLIKQYFGSMDMDQVLYSHHSRTHMSNLVKIGLKEFTGPFTHTAQRTTHISCVFYQYVLWCIILLHQWYWSNYEEQIDYHSCTSTALSICCTSYLFCCGLIIHTGIEVNPR